MSGGAAMTLPKPTDYESISCLPEKLCAVRSIALLGGPSVKLRDLVSMKREEDPKARVCPVNGNVAPDCAEHKAIAPFFWYVFIDVDSLTLKTSVYVRLGTFAQQRKLS